MAMKTLPSHGVCFVCGKENRLGFQLQFSVNESESRLVTRFSFRPEHQGPPGYAHGGSLAAVLDEIMGIAVGYFVHLALAAKIEVSYRLPVPLGEMVEAEAWVTVKRARKVYARGLLLYRGKPAVRGKGLYIRPAWLERKKES